MTDQKPFSAKFDRSSWITLAFAIVILVYILFPAFFTYVIPSDGWSLARSTTGSDFSNDPLFFKTHLVDGPSPLQPNDVLLAVDGHPMTELLSQWGTLNPARPAGWISGGTVRYEILRDGKLLNVDIGLAPLPAQAFFRHAMEVWNSPWLAIFMYAFFLPAMVIIGVFVFFQRPRNLAAQALLIISVTFVGQVSYAPDGTGSLFYWPLSVPYSLLLQHWTAVIIPTTLLLSLAFPSPKGWLRRHLLRSLALIYLPWSVGCWAIVILMSGDLAGINNSWLVLAVLQIGLIFIMAAALIHSFRTVRGPVERAQLKWFAFGFSGFIVTGGLFWIVGSLLNLPALNTLVNYFGYLFLPLCLGIAILRYRLFDIDLIVRRTLVYAIITAALGLLFYGGVTLLQWIFTSLSGQQSPVSIVISTLMIVVLFSPLRRRVQDFIDRRFFRSRYNAEQVLQRFVDRARTQADLTELSGQLLLTVEDAVEPQEISLWLRSSMPPPIPGLQMKKEEN